MEIERMGKAKIVLSATGMHDYFAWPSIVRKKDGAIAVACSGFRIGHICPFGKVVATVSDDEGEHYYPPQIWQDTCLDDRDAGLCAFGQSGLIVTSFNNSLSFQRKQVKYPFGSKDYRRKRAYILSYLNKVNRAEEEKTLGSTYIVSFDNGRTFGKINKSPITSPHGPIELMDGTLLWVGRTFSEDDSFTEKTNCIHVYTIQPERGEMTFVGQIDDVYEDGKKVLSCEPYAVQLPDGKIVCHIRVERGGDRIFTLYQSESADNGRTWTKPRQILEKTGGAPAHLMVHSSGVLISTYGYRNDPPAVRAIFSNDGGNTWSEPVTVCSEIAPTWDMGYPASVELSDGTILTVFYAHPDINGPANIIQQKWRLIL